MITSIRILCTFALAGMALAQTPTSAPSDNSLLGYFPGLCAGYDGEGSTVVTNDAGETTWSQKTAFSAQLFVLDRADDGRFRVAWVVNYGLKETDVPAVGVSFLWVDPKTHAVEGWTSDDLLARGLTLAAPGYSQPLVPALPADKLAGKWEEVVESPLTILGLDQRVKLRVGSKEWTNDVAKFRAVEWDLGDEKPVVSIENPDDHSTRTLNLRKYEVDYVFDPERRRCIKHSAEIKYKEDDGDVEIDISVKERDRKTIDPSQLKELAEGLKILRDATLEARRSPAEHELVDMYLKGFDARFGKLGLSEIAAGLRKMSTATATAAGHVHDVRCLVSQAAPDFSLKDTEGKDVKLSEQKGKAVLLVFWGIGCEFCRMEAPHLTKIAKEYESKGAIVLAVNGHDDELERIKKYAERAKLSHRMLVAGGAVARGQYLVANYPTTFFIDKNGTIVDVITGFDEGVDQLVRQKLDRALGK